MYTVLFMHMLWILLMSVCMCNEKLCIMYTVLFMRMLWILLMSVCMSRLGNHVNIIYIYYIAFCIVCTVNQLYCHMYHSLREDT